VYSATSNITNATFAYTDDSSSSDLPPGYSYTLTSNNLGTVVVMTVVNYANGLYTNTVGLGSTFY